MKKALAIALVLTLVALAWWRLDRSPSPVPEAKLQGTGDSIRLLTFNTYLLSPIMMCKWDLVCYIADADVDFQAKTIGERLMLAHEKFDVIAFNEAWDEDGKDILEDKLSALYPNYVKYVSKQGPDLIQLKKSWGFLGGDIEDSGLMLFSKLLFRPLFFIKDDYKSTDHEPASADEKLAFKEYHDCGLAFEDCRAAKGAALVSLVPASGRFFDLVFTHLQADSGDSEYPEVRQKQFADIQDVLETTQARKFSKWTHSSWLVVAGDLNINGAGAVTAVLGYPHDFLGQGSDEYFDRITAPAQAAQTPLVDAWSETTSPFDKGLTRYDSQQRLDFVLTSRPTFPVPPGTVAHPDPDEICAQHVWNPRELEGLSDHRAVAADLNRKAPQCNPRLAKNVAGNALGQIGQGGQTTVWQLSELMFPGSMQWFRLDDSGTYAIALTGVDEADTEHLRFELYAAHDVSQPIAGTHKLEKTTLTVCGAQVPGAVPTFGGILPQWCGPIEAQKYVLPQGPFFVRVFSEKRTWRGLYAIAFYKFACASQLDACDLLPSSAVSFSFTAGKPLNADDTAWFRIRILEQADSGEPQTVRFFGGYVSGPTVAPQMTFVAKDGLTALSELGGTPIAGPIVQNHTISFTGSTKENQFLFLKSKRPSAFLAAYAMRVGWQTNLTLFGGSAVGPGVPHLVCKDETNGTAGNEWGEDEIRMEINVDGTGWKYLPANGYVSFDCNDWEDSKLWDNYLSLIRFLDKLQIRLVEIDDTSQNDVSPIVSLQAWGLDTDIDTLPANWKTADDKTKLWWKFEGGEYHLRRFNMGRWRVE